MPTQVGVREGVPYRPRMDSEPLLRLIMSLRVTRHFGAEPVSDHDLRRVLEVARWTGSARNRQPWRFVTVSEYALREKLSTLGAYARHLANAPLAVAIGTNDELGGRDTAFDAGRLCQNIALAAYAVGLASCPATLYPDEQARKAAQLVGLDPPWRVEHVLALGHPAVTPTGTSAIAQGRQPLAELSWEL